mmetsp:Transcript_19150/g.39055  ORF Transcript_19150/g.39055 Transcript_19150/m.39055 type:complete len:490 (-) Transcript_19150:639-2108(-)
MQWSADWEIPLSRDGFFQKTTTHNAHLHNAHMLDALCAAHDLPKCTFAPFIVNRRGTVLCAPHSWSAGMDGCQIFCVCVAGFFRLVLIINSINNGVDYVRQQETTNELLSSYEAMQYQVLQQSYLLMILAMCLAWIRLLELLTFFRGFGVLWLTLCQMIVEAIPIAFILVVTCVTAGLAATAYLPSYRDDSEVFMRPWTYGLWAVYGEFDISMWYQRMNEGQRMGDHHVKGNWLPALLWLFMFFTTIFLVNLMIAQITSTFTRIEEKAPSYHAHQEFELVLGFKDEMGPPSPFNIIFCIIKLVYYLVNQLIRKPCKGCYKFLRWRFGWPEPKHPLWGWMFDENSGTNQWSSKLADSSPIFRSMQSGTARLSSRLSSRSFSSAWFNLRGSSSNSVAAPPATAQSVTATPSSPLPSPPVPTTYKLPSWRSTTQLLSEADSAADALLMKLTAKQDVFISGFSSTIDRATTMRLASKETQYLRLYLRSQRADD